MSSSHKGDVLTPLLESDTPLSVKKVSFRNFILFCICFSVSHATVDGVLIYATAELGESLGAVSGGILYIFYSFSALFLAKAFLRYNGARTSLLFGLCFLLTYVTTFVVALGIPSIKWFICVPGSILGGLGAGILWVAQGSYYSQSSHLYAVESHITVDAAHNELAGYFAFIYLGSEALGKFLVTVIYMIYPNNEWEIIAFAIYAALACMSTVASFSIQQLDAQGDNVHTGTNEDTTDMTIRESCDSSGALQVGERRSRVKSIELALWRELFSVYTLVRYDWIFLSLQAYQVSFGFTAAFMTYYVDGIILPDGGKKGYIGLLSSVTVLVAAAAALPLAWFANSNGRHAVMITGALCFAVCCSMVLYIRDDTIADWVVIVPLVVLYGLGRGIWENTNKATVADMYQTSQNERDKAFAGIYFFSGLGAAVGYFVFKFISRFEMGMTTVAIAILALIGNHYCCLQMKISKASNIG